MTAIHPPVSHAVRPLFRADWRGALFIHFHADAATLQSLVPVELDRFDGQAYISLVAFTQARLRPALGGRLTKWLSGPLACHEFLNLRTYVRHGGERGIFFLAEWIPNRLACLLGPRLYGLPYRLGHLDFSKSRRTVTARGRTFCAEAKITPHPPAVSRASSEAEFLLERYTAFTHRNRVLRRFRIEHDRWLQAPASVSIRCNDLVVPWLGLSAPCSAHYSPGLRDVAIGPPERVE